MNIATRNIHDWIKQGVGTINYTDDYTANIVSTAAQSTYIKKYINPSAGSIVEIKAMIKINSGSCYMGIDFPSVGEQKNKTKITYQGWKEYRVKFIVPEIVSDTDYLQLNIGQFGDGDGNCDITNISISIKDSVAPAARVDVCGLITIVDGTPAINTNYTNIGLSTSNIGAATTIMDITINKKPLSASHLYPVFLCSLSRDNSNTFKVIAKAGNYDNTTGTFTVSFIDSTNGNLIDISALGTCYLAVQGISG